MSREIKFRGLCLRRKIWVYGYLSNNDVISTVNGRLKVIPETVGQYTGLKDKNGVEIYEGDVIQVVNGSGKSFIVQYKFASFWKVETSPLAFSNVLDDHYESFIVIGNIHENKQ